MKSNERAMEPMERRRQGIRFLKKRPGLQLRMTISYVVVSVITALLFELIIIGVFFFVILRLPFVDQNTQDATEQTAQFYALQAAVQAKGDTLNPLSTFQSGQPFSLVAPKSSSSQAPKFGLELLIAPNGQIVASSNPSQYPPSASVTNLLPNQVQLVRDALAGKAGHTAEVTAQATDSPGEVLARVNDLLYADIPEKMFVTCFYAILDPDSGRLRYANAGHDLPYQQRVGAACELRANGMPLGLMPGMRYEEQEVVIAQHENILFYTDGLVEAHNPAREMFGFPRLQTLLAEHSDGTSLIDFLLNELKHFTGEGWEQEDDLTLLILQRTTE